MASLGVALNTKHEKGHQDSKTKYKDLPLLGQLNVDADELATIALEEASIEFSSPLLLNTKCHLIIQGRTITFCMKMELQKAYSLIEYRKYMEDRKGWHPNTWDTIHWPTFTSATKKIFSKKLKLSQLLHDKLLLGYECNKCMDTYDPHCQACQEEVENAIHMSQCSNKDYEQWRQSFYKQLVCILKHHNMSGQMIAVLTEDIKAGFQQEEEINPANYSLELHFLIQSQSDIGWLNLFKGLWSKQWLSAHEDYC